MKENGSEKNFTTRVAESVLELIVGLVVIYGGYWGWTQFNKPSKPQQTVSEARSAESPEQVLEKERQEQRKKAEQEKEQKAARVQEVRNGYRVYKEAANRCADEILRVVSAINAGINFIQYSAMMQNLQFEFSKFALRCSEAEKQYDSYKELASAVGSLQTACDLWSTAIRGQGVLEQQEIDGAMEIVRSNLGIAVDQYKRAMDALSRDK